jgi:hypothetical protein
MGLLMAIMFRPIERADRAMPSVRIRHRDRLVPVILAVSNIRKVQFLHWF